MVETVLALFVKDGAVLLGRKKRGLGMGYWNGFGGKIELGESPRDAVLREMHEECGLRARDVEKRGELVFVFEDGSFSDIRVHIFHVGAAEGSLQESEEMEPAWFSVAEIPFALMWDDDRYWFPLFLAGKSFTGEFAFGPDKKVVRHRLREGILGK